MPLIRWQSAADFFVLAVAIYVLLRWAKQARAVRIALAILGLNAGALLARNYDLTITSWVLSTAGLLAVAVLLVVFQPELRHTFMRLDAVIRSGWQERGTAEPARRAIVEAAFSLARQRIGALIVLVRRASIAELIQGGTRLGAEVTRELLEAIFQKPSPLHDGAVIVEAGAITRAGAVLPLTQRPDVPESYGTRHRAAMGLADRSDALVIAVSEERGTVTLMQDGQSLGISGPEQLADLLNRLETESPASWPERARLAMTSNLRLKLAAAGIAAGLWGLALYTAGTTVRTVTVPVVFSNVPAGMNVGSQSAFEVDVQLRGNPFSMAAASLGRMIATLDLRGSQPGLRTVNIRARDLALPPGIRFERASPPSVSVRLAPAR
jgi:diadenylate cyclase